MPGQSGDFPIPGLRDCILGQVTREEFLRDASEVCGGETAGPLLVGETVNTEGRGAPSIALRLAYEMTGLVVPVKGIRVGAHRHVGDLDPARWFKMLEKPSSQRRPVTNDTDEDSDAYHIVVFPLLTGNLLCRPSQRSRQSKMVRGWSRIHVDDVCLGEFLCEGSSPDCASTAEVEQ